MIAIRAARYRQTPNERAGVSIEKNLEAITTPIDYFGVAKSAKNFTLSFG
jgi:hypothetical protein